MVGRHRKPGGGAGVPLRALARVLLVVMLVGPAGCPHRNPRTATVAAGDTVVWPPPPERARIRSIGSIRSPGDIGVSPGMLGRVWKWMVDEPEARLVRPHGAAVDPGGRLWVTDPGNGSVHVFDSDRRRYRLLPAKGCTPLRSPIGVTHDPDGVAYVTDSAAGVVRRVSPDGSCLPPWSIDADLERPTGVAFDGRRGHLWVVDTARHHLIVLDRQGHVVRVVGSRGAAPGQFNFPTHIAVDARGQVYVTDTLNFRVQILSADGEPLRVIGHLGDRPGALNKPKGIAVDAAGRVYVVDSMFDNVQIFDATGRTLLYFGGPGRGPGELWLPAGIAIAGRRIYVADSYNHRVQRFELAEEKNEAP